LEKELRDDARFEGYNYYVMSSFVKFLEAAGARLVPLVPSMSKEETLEKLKKLNGVFLPGGDGDYYNYAKFIFEQVLEFNREGTFYPIWGTCMGF
jgi:gamma-glutamyl hydrolase